MKKVCAALADWLAEHGHTAWRQKFPGVKIQVVFDTPGLAYEAQRIHQLNLEPADIAGDMSASAASYYGVPFEFVGPEIMVKR